MDVFYSIVGFFSSGGLFMYPILLVFAVGTAIAVERFMTLSTITRKNDAAWSALQPLLNQGDFDKARELASKEDSIMARILDLGLALQGAVRRREDVEIAMEEGMTEPRLWCDQGF